MDQDKDIGLPELGNTPEDIEAERVRKRDEELARYWLDPSLDYPEPHFLFEYHTVGFSPLGGIQAISGQKKNGKTFVLAQLMAVALGYNKDRVQTYLSGLTVRESTLRHLGHEPRVLYCDTEMEQLNTAKVLRRVHWLCGWDMKQRNDRFFVQWLREVPKCEKESANHERWRLIKNAIDAVNPDIVFVDGLRDLVNDFNDNAESSEIITEMMSLASQRQLCIWNVLHMNPRPQNDDESKMRGHLGTELGNKVSDTFVSMKKKDATTGKVSFVVKQQDARGKDVDDWTFEVVDNAGGLGIPRMIVPNAAQIASMQATEEDIEISEVVRVLKGIIFPPNTEFLSNIFEKLKRELHVGKPKAQKLFNKTLEKHPGLAYQRRDNKWVLNKDMLSAYEQNLPFVPREEDVF